MSQKCGVCEKVVYKRVYDVNKHCHVGIDCGCRRLSMIPRTTVNPFDITFDHVADSFGNKLHVENIRQLEAAEKTYGFQSVVLHSDAQNFDDPPQQHKVDMASIHNWRYSSEGRYRERYGR